jgi:acyl carrier protein
LPVTANGKVDRAALPAPTQSRSDPEAAIVSPRTPVEAKLAQIWSELLGIEQVGIHDNFFELGGHSLLATQLASRLRKDLQVELHLPEFFKAQTIADLARLVEQSCRAQTTTARAIKAQPRGGRSLDSLLARLDDLSEVETDRLLGRKEEH